ncbi:MAG: hypothetical protein FWC16_03580 [Defluviitaleaceae bacterium]|nr:hypothetical protein [Defluviitaleaceae bacterium]MCL2273984.1 hypothetical protein [Defluviitaleaceae bacterium]
MTQYPRGSEWRRWDLHVHTASSYDSDYKGEDADSLLADVLIAENIAVVGITDHFVIDKTRIENLRNLAPEITFFPGVELRTDKGDTNIHVILLFSDKLDLDILVEDFNVFKRTASNYDNNDKICWDYASIVEFAQKRDALISIHAGRKTNGVDDRISNVLPCNQAVKEDYSTTVHIYEMSQPRDLEEYKKIVFPTIGVRPMIICSDNHDPRSYNPTHKLWIKADPTFNGLRQIIYEPEERVCISETKPQMKSSYQVIESVTITHDDFQSEPIIFNDKLNCIIGGKSTGKSILLHNLARAISPKQVEEKCEITGLRTKKDKSVKPMTMELDTANLTVRWLGGGDTTERKIVYIPQTYLNRLADSSEETTEIDKIVERIVLERKDSSGVALVESKRNLMAILDSMKSDCTNKLLEILRRHEQIKQYDEQISELGGKEPIEKEMASLRKQRDDLSQKMNLSEDDIKSFDAAVSNIEQQNKIILQIEKEVAKITETTTILQPRNSLTDLSEETLTEVQQIIDEIVSTANAEWESRKSTIVSGLESKKAVSVQSLAESIIVRDKLKETIESNKAIQELANRMTVEAKKLTDIAEIEKRKIDEHAQFTVLLNAISESYVGIYADYEAFANHLNESTQNDASDLSYHVQIPFRQEDFIKKWEETFGVKSSKSRELVDSNDFELARYTADFIKRIITKTLNGELNPLKGASSEQALRGVLDDWYNIKYVVKMGNDTIEKMSPGKKALVLLKLLIELADSDCPILIDQPEDDLDNRSVYDLLIDFIRRKKINRQIIVVTHNANIVLGADSDEIIVANQHIIDSNSRRFEYRSGSIENDYPAYKNDGTVAEGVLNEQGIQQHICDILEGGIPAFEKRKNKYHI